MGMFAEGLATGGDSGFTVPEADGSSEPPLGERGAPSPEPGEVALDAVPPSGSMELDVIKGDREGQRHGPASTRREWMARRPRPKNLDPLLVRLMALAEPSRWRLLEILRERSATVQQLATESGLSLAVTSRHVSRLRQSGLVIGERHGKELRCRPADPEDAGGPLAG